MRKMKCITIHQPYAWAIIHGAKRIENRTWQTHYRGRLAIHAGTSLEWMTPVLDDGTRVPDSALEFGAVIGAVTLVDCVRPDHPSIIGSPFAHGPWCWVLAAPKALAVSVRMRGRQGLFDIDADAILAAQAKPWQRPRPSSQLFDARAS